MRSRFTSKSNFGRKRRLINFFGRGLTTVCVLMAAASLAWAEVPSGSLEEATAYFATLSKTLKYSTPEKIGETTLTDLADYLGYKTLTAEKLEFDPVEVTPQECRDSLQYKTQAQRADRIVMGVRVHLRSISRDAPSAC